MNKFVTALGIVAAFIATPAFAGNTTVTVLNESSSDVMEVYMSDSLDGDWGPDLLGYEILPTGWNVPEMEPTIWDYDSCSYDIKVVFDDGRTAAAAEIDACEASNITIRDSHFVVETVFGEVYRVRAIIE